MRPDLGASRTPTDPAGEPVRAGERVADGPRPAAGPVAAEPPPVVVRRHLARLLRWLGYLGCVTVAVWSLGGTGVGVGPLVEGREGIRRLLAGLFPPDLDAELLRQIGAATVETIQISVAALVGGTALGLPLAVLIAGNVRAPRPLALAARGLATVLRGVPELLWALLFVSAVGLGPAAGVYAIGLHSAGMIAKLCSEQLEAVDPAPVEALRLTGASRTATAVLAVVPQARATVASQLLYQWECNVRSSVVIGYVGAGGLGQELGIALHLFRYQELATLMAAVLLLVLLVDGASVLVRRRLGVTAALPGECERPRYRLSRPRVP
ncbi:phosphonate ABC transporter, permease protein PhnE [Micromonospora sp. NPDC049559]|uniref:phosphonate ABC transporter, permease protein PhnE n=1 Tax=Micromonospora sp. NPDC049559 TaxID=3155923 RepID=UPI00342C45DC